MEILKIDHPLGVGSLYEFRQNKKLGLPLGNGLTATEKRLLDIRAVFPLESINFLESDQELKLIFKRGFKNYQLLDKFIAKKTLVCFTNHNTVWQVKDILFLTHSPYREITLTYHGVIDYSGSLPHVNKQVNEQAALI